MPSSPHFSQQVCLDSKDVIRQNARRIRSYTIDFTFYLLLFCFIFKMGSRIAQAGLEHYRGEYDLDSCFSCLYLSSTGKTALGHHPACMLCLGLETRTSGTLVK